MDGNPTPSAVGDSLLSQENKRDSAKLPQDKRISFKTKEFSLEEGELLPVPGRWRSNGNLTLQRSGLELQEAAQSLDKLLDAMTLFDKQQVPSTNVELLGGTKSAEK